MNTETPVRRVIIDIDDRSQPAFDWARRTAGDLGVPLIAWTTVQRQSAERSPTDEERFENERARTARAWLAEQSIDPEDVRVAVADSGDELVHQATAGDLVVLGIEHSEGVSGWALGSRAHALAHELPCPLVVVPPGEPPPAGAPVIVGADGTEANLGVIRWAKSIAERTHRSCLQVLAYDPMYDTFDNAGYYGAGERSARRAAERRASPLREKPGDPAEVLSTAARDRHAYLTVVGARNEHSLGGLLLGSVPDHLLHAAPGPVAIVTYAYEQQPSDATSSPEPGPGGRNGEI